ncbi:MAG TPA: hypothetical protein VJA00_02820, partial [Candidatus Omnitrophota bacterium]|nr:hypothetical protein [Candidatus Omnitrophota bacterium]
LAPAVLVFVLIQGFVFAATVQELDQKIENRDTAFYRDFFDGVFYKPFVRFLRFDQMATRAQIKKRQARDINVFDEVPDSSFFVNRHGRRSVSLEELKRGPAQGTSLDPKGPWTVTKGKVEGMSTGFFIKDQSGVGYLLKFDPKDNPEMATAAEIISHKFFYAFGYHVAEYYLVYFSSDILQPDPNATYYDENGFKKPLTQEALQELIDRIPKFKGGELRASASKLLPKPRKGYMDFDGRRASDPDDLISHEDRRSIRSLRVFGSWLNHYDLRRDNTMDVVVEENGRAYVKHYLIDFGSTLGSAAYRPKVPAAGYEHIVDWAEIGKAIPTLKLVQKSWEKRWDELNREVKEPAIGIFDNYYFDPGRWKTQLPYEAFDRLTDADGFWAAKTIMSFSNEQIKTLVSTGEYSDPEDEQLLTQILIARRDLVGRYWFDRTAPLDQIQLLRLSDRRYEIRFSDLGVRYGFSSVQDTTYRYRLTMRDQNGAKQAIPSAEFETPSFSFEIPPGNDPTHLEISIQLKRKTGDWSKPPVTVTLARRQADASFEVAEIDHGV